MVLMIRVARPLSAAAMAARPGAGLAIHLCPSVVDLGRSEAV